MKPGSEHTLKEELTGSILEVLAHPIRRSIISLIGSAESEGVSYTELLTEMQVSTGRLNYHLRQMEGYLEKNDSLQYVLTPLGRKAHETLSIVRKAAESDLDVAKYYKPVVKHSPLVMLVKGMMCILVVGISVPIFFITLSIIGMINAGGDPTYIVSSLLALAIGVAVLVWLLLALRYAPGFATKIEERLYG
jgi:hypothetical protein